MARKRYVIVGDGAAGLTAAEEIRRRAPDAAIGVFCDDPNPGYFRAALTNFLLGELREDQLWAVAPNFYDPNGPAVHEVLISYCVNIGETEETRQVVCFPSANVLPGNSAQWSARALSTTQDTSALG